MKLIENVITETLNEHHLIETLNLNEKIILELGCGAASMTQKIAFTGFERNIIACETDMVQHKKNLQLDIDNIYFRLGEAQDIEMKDNSVDMIFMFKSFHHIPKKFMVKALAEIKRVLKPNGLAYISEPLFTGSQNELVAMFHDEEKVRIDAFEAIKNCVETNELKLFKELFFQTEVNYKNFEDFKEKQMNLTYNSDNSDDELEEKIKQRYHTFANQDGSANFLKPFRVDILQKV